MRPTFSIVSASLAFTLLAGCRVNTHKNGANENVNIGTPFGNMQVRTNGNADTSGFGMTLYPGAVLEQKEKDGHSEGAADINMNFGSFHLGVKAAGYRTPDSPAMVVAFYKKDLARYGAVLQCDGKHAVGDVSRTADGLTCDDESGGKHVSWSSAEDGKTELRAGSRQHQHIITVERKDNGTKIGLVALDLPSGVSKGDQGTKDSD